MTTTHINAVYNHYYQLYLWQTTAIFNYHTHVYTFSADKGSEGASFLISVIRTSLNNLLHLNLARACASERAIEWVFACIDINYRNFVIVNFAVTVRRVDLQFSSSLTNISIIVMYHSLPPSSFSPFPLPITTIPLATTAACLQSQPEFSSASSLFVVILTDTFIIAYHHHHPRYNHHFRQCLQEEANRRIGVCTLVQGQSATSGFVWWVSGACR